MKMKLMLFIAVLCLAVSPAPAQSTTQGAIAGTVFDPTNAIIPNAKVLIHNDGTNAEQTLTADSSGYFKAPQLAPGSYTVTASAPGFTELRSRNVTVQVNLVTELDQHLQPGSESQTVEVTAEAPVLNFESPVYGGHLSNTEIESLPMNNRRWSTLALLTPGATVDTNGFGLIQFRAISPLLNNVEIDGADDNQAFFAEERGRTRAGYSTSQAAVREFTVNSGVYSAEFGRAVGGVVNSVTKSGTNTLHGELYFYNRDSSRAAYQPLTTNTTYDSTTNQYVTTPYKPTDKRNQFGFGVGGPLIRDKLFWFYSFDMFRRNFPGTAKANNPASFFTTPDSALPGGQTCNTKTGAVAGSGVSTIDTQACLLAARLGVTYSAAATAYNQQLQSILTALGPVPRFGDQEINTPKLDWQINGNEHLSALYHRLRWDSPGGVQTQSTNNYAVDSFGTDFVKLDYGVVKLDSLFGRFTNELRYQYGRELNDEGRQPPSAYTTGNLTNSTGVPVQLGLLSSSTQIGLTMGTPYYSFRAAYPDERKWQIGDTASTMWGKHNIKFGEDFVHNDDLQNNLYEGNGYYSYTSTIVNYFSDLLSKGKTCNASGSGTGSASAGYYPCYNSFYQGFGPSTFELTTQDYGVFVQDDWKVSSRLTVNLGVRYDYEKLPAPFAGLTTIPQTAYHPSDRNNIAPRIGFAWDPYGLGKTVVRGGYGMYYGRIPNAILLNAFENTGSPNSQGAYTFSSSTAGAPILPGVAATTPPATSAGPNIQYLADNLQNPMTHQFDLVVQQELGWGTVLSVSYIGALGRELPNFLNLNLSDQYTYTANYRVTPANNGGTCGPIACGTVIPTKVYASKLQTGSATSAYSYVTPNPAYGAITAVTSNVTSSYHGVTVEVQKRASKMLSFDALYTWSHALDFNQNASTAASTNNWFDPLDNARENYGNSNFNIPNRVVSWALLNFPGVNEGSAWKYLANGWSLKPLLQAQSGLPYSVTVGGSTPNQCYAAGCLQAWSSGLSGTGVSYIPQLGRNTFQYPRTIVVDMRAQKEFTFAEKYNLQLIGEAFNLANHQNVTGISTQGYSNSVTQGLTPAATSSALTYQTSYGAINSVNSNYAYGTRQIQLAARLVF